MSEKGTAPSGYGIGAVVRRTGLSAPNIRMWEKRYGAVVPERTATNRRIYSKKDVERLSLLHRLTERGHSISNIANLSLADLRERLSEEENLAPSNAANGEGRPQRVMAIGSRVGELLSKTPFEQTTLTRQFSDLAVATDEARLPESDLIVIETDTLFPEMIPSIREIVQRTRAKRTVLVYRFSPSKTTTALARTLPGINLFVAPVSDEQLRRECLVQLEALDPRRSQAPVDSEPLPERLYTPDQLRKLTRIRTTVECECPQHLAGLLQGLAAFEKYSSACEDRNPQDALLHAYLHRTTARARRSLEEALRHLLETEGVSLD